MSFCNTPAYTQWNRHIYVRWGEIENLKNIHTFEQHPIYLCKRGQISLSHLKFDWFYFRFNWSQCWTCSHPCRRCQCSIRQSKLISGDIPVLWAVSKKGFLIEKNSLLNFVKVREESAKTWSSLWQRQGSQIILTFSFPRGFVYTISSIFFVVDRFWSSPNPVKIFGTLGKIIKQSLRDPSARATFSDL